MILLIFEKENLVSSTVHELLEKTRADSWRLLLFAFKIQVYDRDDENSQPCLWQFYQKGTAWHHHSISYVTLNILSYSLFVRSKAWNSLQTHELQILKEWHFLDIKCNSAEVFSFLSSPSVFVGCHLLWAVPRHSDYTAEQFSSTHPRPFASSFMWWCR